MRRRTSAAPDPRSCRSAQLDHGVLEVRFGRRACPLDTKPEVTLSEQVIANRAVIERGPHLLTIDVRNDRCPGADQLQMIPVVVGVDCRALGERYELRLHAIVPP